MARQMSTKTAQSRLKKFVKENQGKVVVFSLLDDAGKFNFVMLKTYVYFSGKNDCAGLKLENSKALERAVRNAYAHKSSNYANYDPYGTQMLRFAK